ncbi:hypothetical protein M752DRAFT_85363 [Aspergillus phoenicis ATCC 13157]|nr:hypothetical protein M752DRAFT_85363 [Aspergillus phoenicis ATCC 13157]
MAIVSMSGPRESLKFFFSITVQLHRSLPFPYLLLALLQMMTCLGLMVGYFVFPPILSRNISTPSSPHLLQAHCLRIALLVAGWKRKYILSTTEHTPIYGEQINRKLTNIDKKDQSKHPAQATCSSSTAQRDDSAIHQLRLTRLTLRHQWMWCNKLSYRRHPKMHKRCSLLNVG